jgi:tetratricopeptide (TPR) repeat protein
MKMLFLLPALAFAQPKFVAPAPDRDSYVIDKDVEYRAGLAMDVYRAARGDRLPVTILMNTGMDSTRNFVQFMGWAALVASQGFVAINPDSDPDHVPDNFDALVAYIRAHAAALHADPDRIAIFAWSGNAGKSFGLAETHPAIRAAAFYYGAGAVERWRLDLPVYWVRAGLDREAMNSAIDRLYASAIKVNAPVTLVNFSSGHHGFDVLDDNDLSREVIASTIRFLKTALDPKYAAALSAHLTEPEAASAAARGDFETAAKLYAPLASADPESVALQISYGEALLGAKRYREALEQLEKVKDRAGFRDFGLPASRAAALAGEPDKAIEYLTRIPARFLPASELSNPAYQSLKGRPEFEVLSKR